MASSVIVTEGDRYTVAGLIRHLARQQRGRRDAGPGRRAADLGGGVRRGLSRRAGSAARRARRRRPDRLPRPQRHRVLRLPLRGLAHRCSERRGQLASGAGRDGGDHRRLRRAALGDPRRLPAGAWPTCGSGLPSVRRIVVIGDGSAPHVPTRGPCPSTSGSTAARPRTRATSERPDEVSMQLYTSGTTGLPKGVMLTNANLSTAIAEADVTFHISDDTVSLVAMPLFHIGGSGWALCAMSRGGRSIILRDVDPAVLLADRRRADHRDVRRPRRADAPPGHARRWPRPTSRACDSSSTARPRSPRTSWSSAWRPSAAASARSTG